MADVLLREVEYFSLFLDEWDYMVPT